MADRMVKVSAGYSHFGFADFDEQPLWTYDDSSSSSSSSESEGEESDYDGELSLSHTTNNSLKQEATLVKNSLRLKKKSSSKRKKRKSNENLVVNVHVVDKSFRPKRAKDNSTLTSPTIHTFRVVLGLGNQTVKWLSLAVMERLQTKYKRQGQIRAKEYRTGSPGSFVPLSVVSLDPETDCEFLTPTTILRSVINHNEHLYVYLHQLGEKPTEWQMKSFFQKGKRSLKRYNGVDGSNKDSQDNKETSTSSHYSSNLSEDPKKKVWEKGSVFMSKALEADSHTFYDTKKIIQQACKADWTHCKIPRFMKTEEDQQLVFEVLKRHYRTLKELFRYYCTDSSLGSPFSLSLQGFLLFMRHSGLNPKDIDVAVMWKEVNYERISMAENDDDSLARFEFMEILMRISWKLSVKKKMNHTPAEAFNALLHEYVLPNAFQNCVLNGVVRSDFFSDADWFRKNRFYFEEIDALLQRYIRDLLVLYLIYRDDDTDDGSEGALFLGYSEFICMLDDANMFSRTFSRREAKIAIVYSQMCTIDEVDSTSVTSISHHDHHDQCTFSEFLEALARCAEVAFDSVPWLAPLSYKLEIFLILLTKGHKRLLQKEKAKLKRLESKTAKSGSVQKKMIRSALGRKSKKRQLPEYGPEYQREEPYWDEENLGIMTPIPVMVKKYLAIEKK